MAELEADTVVILSSELISKIVGEYFNKRMFREKVEIVDLRPTETGYMFSVAFATKVKEVSPSTQAWINEQAADMNAMKEMHSRVVRAANGKFAKVKE